MTIETPTRFEDLTMITLTRACHLLQMGQKAVLALVESGLLPAYQIQGVWRFREEHVTRLLHAH